MNPIPEGALDDQSPFRERSDIDVVVFPTLIDLKEVVEARLLSGAQCAHYESNGAHTGDVSMEMIADLGCRYVLCGHSERRQSHGETDEEIAEQAIKALEAKLHPVVCIGETAEERDANKQEAVVAKQMKLLPLESDITIAYEPVWAIGTGNTATPEQAQEMHAFIRSNLPDDRKDATRILYGGSMKPENAKELLEQEDIDGGLIGGAALKIDQFESIVNTASSLAASVS